MVPASYGSSKIARCDSHYCLADQGVSHHIPRMNLSSHPPDQFRKACMILAATLILPALANAGTDNGNGNGGQNNGNQNGRNHAPVPVVPEANAVWVLVPFLGAVLLFSARRLFRGKVTG
jgi:hypothetical protein